MYNVIAIKNTSGWFTHQTLFLRKNQIYLETYVNKVQVKGLFLVVETKITTSFKLVF
jgi:hypothetical protein